LEESLAAYQEARILLTECTAYLDTAELSIKQVTENGEIFPLNLEE
jgi:exonuclease VII small subunit